MSTSAGAVRRVAGSILSAASLRPLTPRLGAVASTGLDLRRVHEAEREELEEAVVRSGRGLLVVRDQHDFTVLDHLRFSSLLGEPEPHPIVKGLDECPEVLQITRNKGDAVNFGETWHSDNSYMQRPTSYSILRSTTTMPPVGANDTLFTSTEAAYDALSSAMKEVLDGVKAVHSASKAFDASSNERFDSSKEDRDMKYNRDAEDLRQDSLHPVVRTHPITGNKSLFVNSMFTTRLDGFSTEESDALLGFLLQHIARPEFQARVSWEENQVVIWDNRMTQHIALSDDNSHTRIMQRVSLKGEVPM